MGNNKNDNQQTQSFQIGTPILGGPILHEPILGAAPLHEEEAVYGEFEGREIRNRDIKEIVGTAISQVHGILGLRSNLTDIFKSDEDLTRGITVTMHNNHPRIGVKLITQSGFDEDQLIEDSMHKINDALMSEANLQPEKIEINIADVMTEAEFLEKYRIGRELH